MKNSFFFKHDNNARHNKKIVKLRMKFGWEGYGIFWAIIEYMYESDGYIENVEEELSFALNVDKELLREIVDHSLNIGLFKKKNGGITSDEVLYQLEVRKRMVEGGRKGGKKGKKKGGVTPTNKGGAKQERRGEERKEEDRREYIEFLENPSDKIVDKFSEKYKVSEQRIRDEMEKALNWVRSEGKYKKDYNAFFHNWIKKSKEFEKDRNDNPILKDEAFKKLKELDETTDEGIRKASAYRSRLNEKYPSYKYSEEWGEAREQLHKVN